MPITSWIEHLYGTIRPILFRLGVLSVARKLFSNERRAQVASLIGLAGFDLTETEGYVVPKRNRVARVKFDGINFAGDLRADIGVGEAARQLFNAIRVANIPISYIEVPLPFGERSQHPPSDLNDTPYYSINLIHINPTELPKAAESELKDIITTNYTIAYWHWELSQFPTKWLPIIDYVDEIWVASRFIQETMSHVTRIPVRHIPLPITVEPKQVQRSNLSLPDDRFIFLYVFSPTSNVARKNPFGFIEAFKIAFGEPQSGPLLVIKTHHLDTPYGQTLRNELRNTVQSVNGILIEENLSRQATIDLINCCDCYVSLHRSEGFGLSIAEAMALGKPVIATGYSGNLDFTLTDNSYKVEYNLRHIDANDHKFFPPMEKIYAPGLIWAEPNLEHAAQLMTEIYENQDGALEVGLMAQEFIKEHYNINSIGQLITARLNELDQTENNTSKTLAD